MKISVLQLGARMHYAVPVILQEAGILECLYTDSFAGNKPALSRLLRTLPSARLPELVRRWRDRRPSVALSRVRSFEVFGWQAVWRIRRSRTSAERLRAVAAISRAFNRRVINSGLRGAGALYGFNVASLEAFEWATRRGLPCILEQCIAPKRAECEIIGRELAEWPGWQPELHLPGPDNPIQAREEAEWKLANMIVCPSEFVRNHMLSHGVAPERLRVVPYGVAAPVTAPGAGDPRNAPRDCRRSLRVLFVGEVGLRKGAQYLLEALQLCKGRGIEARFVGRCPLEEQVVKRYAEVAEFLGPIPRSEVAAQYRWADVFCLPSLFEGSATVIYEAVMHGLAVLTTPNAGPPPASYRYGTIVEPRSAEAIAEALCRYCDDPDLLEEHRSGAVASQGELSLDAYASRLLEAIHSLAPRTTA